ncbi:DUF4236 domain-containing protein [bacterium]|nr:DUF4236 domain-containing protein [bacterium]
MGFRLFRRIRIAPGIRVNLGKSGLSLSGGVRGARVTVGRRGVRGTIGAPGTGVSYTETSGGGGAGSSTPAQGGGIGCGTILVLLFLLGFVVNQCSPSNGSWRQSADPTAESTPSASPTLASPTADTSAPIVLSVTALPVVKRGGAVNLEIRAAYGSTCEVGVPLAARTGDAPAAIELPDSGTATVTWKAGAKAATSVITVVCTLGEEREAIEMTLVVR